MSNDEDIELNHTRVIFEPHSAAVLPLLGITLATLTAPPAVLVFENARYQQQLRQQLGTGLDDALDIVDCSDITK